VLFDFLDHVYFYSLGLANNNDVRRKKQTYYGGITSSLP
jgi:hypothetical protein